MKKIDITKDQVKTQREAIMWHLKTYGKITILIVTGKPLP